MNRTRARRLVVAICGAGHSGSTLLGLVLGSHSHVFYAGEAKKSLFLGDANKPLKKRVCKLCGEGCKIWGKLDGSDGNGVVKTGDLYAALTRITGRRVVVDSTKSIPWIEERAAEMRADEVAYRRIFLTRDGRAVVNSRLRKGGALDEEIDRWLGQVADTEKLIEAEPEVAIRVRYEELATAPVETMQKVCAFLELPFEETMLEYEKHEHHPLGGNQGTQSIVARAAGADSALAVVPGRSENYYRDLQRGFRLDLRWRDELTKSDLAEFERRAGGVNARYAWDGSDRSDHDEA